MEKIKIILVDDHALIRESWAFLLSQNPTFDIIAQTDKGEEAIHLAKIYRPDIIIMDINLLGMNGIKATEKINTFSPGTSIMGVSMYNQPWFAKTMFDKGAMGFITKNSSPEEMYEGIYQIFAGRKFICNELKDLLSVLEFEEKGRYLPLSKREIEVTNLIKIGLSSKQIAEKLFIALRTVEVHRHNILKKFKLKNSIELVNLINEKPHLLG